MTNTTRREFVHKTARGLGLAYVFYHDPSIAITAQETVVDVSARIERVYGVMVLPYMDNSFTRHYRVHPLRTSEHVNDDLKLEEALEFEKVFSKCPYMEHLAQVFVTYRPSRQEEALGGTGAGGTYAGRFWGDFLEEPLEKLFERPLVFIVAPRKVNFESPFPIEDAPGQLRYHGKTYGENFQVVVLHETGHALEDRLLFLMWGEEGYRDRTEETRQKYLPENFKDIGTASHPILSHVHPDNPFFKYDKYGDKLADFFARGHMAISTLSEKERKFFEEMDKGLRSNPEQFLKMLAQNPQMLSEVLRNLPEF